jgi:hypothetical protein
MIMKNLLMTTIAIFGLATVSMAQLPSYIPSNGLVGWWPFNGSANNEGGINFNAFINGATLSNDRFGNPHRAYSFDGENDYINVGNPPSLPNPPSSYTQSVWLKLPSWPSGNIFANYPIISKRHQNNGNDWATARIQIDGKCYFFADDAFHENIISAVSPIISINTWYHFVFVKELSNYKIFLNGNLVSSAVDNHLMSGSDNDILFGAQLAWNSFFKGQLDDIAIWNRALNANEIKDLYSACQLAVTIQPINKIVKTNLDAQFIVGSSDSNATFQWQTDLGVGFQNLNNVAQYRGSTDDTLIVSNLTLSNNNQPFRCIIRSGFCSDTSNVAVLTVNNNVGISEIMNEKLISIFPNPCQRLIYLRTDSKLIGEIYSIIDSTGRIVLKGKIESDITSIELDNLSVGFYLFYIADNINQSLKIIKQ